ncbi:hypothetical protein B0H13DRAFT_1935569 [Mycena leptocephala]|nr:hypothetical protein B0H13DRAFT_1935569 [Mycena leptocephala]
MPPCDGEQAANESAASSGTQEVSRRWSGQSNERLIYYGIQGLTAMVVASSWNQWEIQGKIKSVGMRSSLHGELHLVFGVAIFNKIQDVIVRNVSAIRHQKIFHARVHFGQNIWQLGGPVWAFQVSLRVGCRTLNVGVNHTIWFRGVRFVCTCTDVSVIRWDRLQVVLQDLESCAPALHSEDQSKFGSKRPIPLRREFSTTPPSSTSRGRPKRTLPT